MRETREAPTQHVVGVQQAGRSMQKMERARMQTRAEDRKDGLKDRPTHRTRSQMDARSRQQAGITGQKVLLLGLGKLERPQGIDGNSRVVSHVSNRLIPMMK